jgi:hypothetical protein
MPELYNGRAPFRKRDNKTVWLRFTTHKNWIVSPAADKEANSNAGYAFAPGGDSALPPLSGWQMQEGDHFVADEGISVTLSYALVVSLPIRCCRVPTACVSSWNIFICYCTAASVYFAELVLGCSGRLDGCRVLKVGTRVDQGYGRRRALGRRATPCIRTPPVLKTPQN